MKSKRKGVLNVILMLGLDNFDNGGIINRNKKFRRKERNLRKKNDRLKYIKFEMI